MEFDDLIPTEEAPAGSRATGGKKAMSKIHIGFDVELGEDGYTAFNSLRQDINEKRKGLGYNGVPQRDFALYIADKSGVKTDKFKKLVSEIQDSVKEYITSGHVEEDTPEEQPEEEVEETEESESE